MLWRHILPLLLFVLQFSGVAGNGTTPYFLIFAILAGVLGVVSKLAGGTRIRVWRNDSLAAAGSCALVAWAVTALAMGFASKEIDIGVNRGWRLWALEAFIIILYVTQLYVLVIHAGIFSSKYGPGYRDFDYGVGAGAGVDPVHKEAGGGGLGFEKSKVLLPFHMHIILLSEFSVCSCV